MCCAGLLQVYNVLCTNNPEPIKPFGENALSLQQLSAMIGTAIVIVSTAIIFFAKVSISTSQHLSVAGTLGSMMVTGGAYNMLGLSAFALAGLSIYTLVPLAGMGCTFVATLIK